MSDNMTGEGRSDELIQLVSFNLGSEEFGIDIIGMVVDSVSEVLRIPKSTMEPPPAVTTSVDQHYISGVVKLENRLPLLMDVSRIASEVADAIEQNDAVIVC